MLKFEEYLSDFTNTINLVDFILGLLVAAFLSLILKYFYIRFATSVSSREKFASNFVPLALATMLVISVVQASIALSLGLVGALSIVRFRAAIKEPEELTYLFLTIGIGLVTGANKPLLALIAMAIILPLIYLNRIFRSKEQKIHDHMFLNIKTQKYKLADLTKEIEEQLAYVELKRIEEGSKELFVAYLTKANNVKQIDDLISILKKTDPDIHISMIDQPRLII